MNPVTLSTNTTRDPARVWLLRIQLGLYRFPGYPRLAACIRNLEPGNQKSARVTTIGYRYPVPSDRAYPFLVGYLLVRLRRSKLSKRSGGWFGFAVPSNQETGQPVIFIGNQSL
jgi:hypothetical protein